MSCSSRRYVFRLHCPSHDFKLPVSLTEIVPPFQWRVQFIGIGVHHLYCKVLASVHINQKDKKILMTHFPRWPLLIAGYLRGNSHLSNAVIIFGKDLFCKKKNESAERRVKDRALYSIGNRQQKIT